MFTGLSQETMVFIKLAVSGAAGSLVRHLALKEDWKDALSTVTVGTLLAVFIGPALTPIWSLNGIIQHAGMSATQILLMSGFCTGVCGMVMTGFIIDLFKSRAAKVIPKKRGRK